MRDAVTLPVRTGMENVLAKRTGSTFAKACEFDGVVKSVTDKGITIEYVDGTTESSVLGRVFGRWAGDILPHDIITNLKEGDKVKKGDIYCYNQLYFQPDRFNKNNVVFKNGILARTVMVESNEVFEDSCVLSSQTAEKLMTAKTYTRSINVTADQVINDLIKVGTVVYPDSILCTIVNHQSDTGFFNEEALASLKSVGSLNPKAKYAGIVERIEVIYSADIEEMSESLQQIVNQSDKELHKTAKSLGQKTLTGYVIPGTNIEGNRTTNQTVILKFYITKGITHGVGDKVVFGNQLKSTVSRVWHDVQTTEKDNKPFDAFFSYISIDKRIVRSVDLIGSTSTLCVRLGELALAAYDS